MLRQCHIAAVGSREHSGSGTFGHAADLCALDRDADIHAIHALEPCQARHEHLFYSSLPCARVGGAPDY
jgi:hypothetical protein